MNLTKFIKKNKIVVMLITVALLAVILPLSLYYGLKKTPTPGPKPGPTSSPSTSKFININNVNMASLSPYGNTNNNIILNTEGFNSDNIYIKIENITVNNIDLTNIERNFLEIVRFVSLNKLKPETNTRGMDFITFTEIMNTNNRMLAVSSYNEPDANIKTKTVEHKSYVNDYSNKITIEIQLFKDLSGKTYSYIYIISTNYINSETGINEQKVLFKVANKSAGLYLDKINQIVFNKDTILSDITNGSEITISSPSITVLSDIRKFPKLL
jgi:hypothetical protein